MRDFFFDCPWLQIPTHRQALIVEHPSLLRPRLLGGAPKDGKISKLAALAAKRRQQDALKLSSTGSDQTGSTEDYTDTLKKLRISQASQISKPDQSSSAEKDEDSRPSTDEVTTDQAGKNEDVRVDQRQNEPLPSQDLRAGPSPFASLLIGATPDIEPASSVSVPTLDSIVAPFDFSGPSPDDLVDKAQNSKPR